MPAINDLKAAFLALCLGQRCTCLVFFSWRWISFFQGVGDEHKQTGLTRLAQTGSGVTSRDSPRPAVKAIGPDH